jgi:probable rRNA maturation factor
MITIQITKSFSDIKVSLPRIKKLVRLTCKRFHLSNVTVSIAIVDNAQIRKINARFLNSRTATDCLSFDLSDEHKSFELVVNGQLALKEAGLRGHGSEAELALYITHGLLHNLGFDDSTQKQAEKMHKMEDEILQQFGYGLVYNKNRCSIPDVRRTTKKEKRASSID